MAELEVIIPKFSRSPIKLKVLFTVLADPSFLKKLGMAAKIFSVRDLALKSF